MATKSYWPSGCKALYLAFWLLTGRWFLMSGHKAFFSKPYVTTIMKPGIPHTRTAYLGFGRWEKESFVHWDLKGVPGSHAAN